MKHTIITKKEFIRGTNLPPILNTKEYKSLVEKYNKQEEKEQKYCYKPYRNLLNYMQL